MSDKDSNKEHQYKINHSIADPNQEAATPVPAATVLLVREGTVSYTHLTLPTIVSV